MTLLVHLDFSVLGLLKFTVNLNCKAYSSQWLMSKITVYPQACMLGFFFFPSLSSICFFLDICFKIKKCFGQVNTLKFGQSKSLFRASQVVLAVKNLPANAGRRKRYEFNPWVGKTLWRRAWQPTPVFSPGESHGQRSLAGYSPWGCKEWDTTKATHRNEPESL